MKLLIKLAAVVLLDYMLHSHGLNSFELGFVIVYGVILFS